MAEGINTFFGQSVGEREHSLYNGIFKAFKESRTLLAILIDPEKFAFAKAEKIITALPKATTHILVGGSTDRNSETQATVIAIKKHTDLPVILFPGSHKQITAQADGILFLSLLSGRNPEYLIGQQLKAVPKLMETNLEILPTGYILIDGGHNSAVARVSATEPMARDAVAAVVHTALAGQYAGKKLVYLEAGSGAKHPVPLEMVRAVHDVIDIPLIIGGGLRSPEAIQAMYNAGATMVVTGTVFEEGIGWEGNGSF